MATEKTVIPESSSSTASSSSGAASSASSACSSDSCSDDEKDTKDAVGAKPSADIAPTKQVLTEKRVYKPVVFEPKPSTSGVKQASLKSKTSIYTSSEESLSSG